jgi:uncharacterized protein YkwD
MLGDDFDQGVTLSVTTFFRSESGVRLLGLLAACVLIFGFTFNEPVRAQSAPTLDGEEWAFVEMLNDYRRQNGITTPLQVSIALTNAAKWHSGDMAQFGYFAHIDHLGRDPFVRMADFGYAYPTSKGENIAAGNSAAAATFDQWRNSPPHNANMLDSDYRAIGIGRAAGGPYGYYWTTTFGGHVDATLPAITLSRTSQSFAANGGPGSLNVVVGSGEGWTVVNNDPAFITVTSGGGVGPGAVTYSIAAHLSNTPRTGTITVAGVNFTVLQGAHFNDVPTTHPFYTLIGQLSARGITVGCGGGNFCPESNVTREQMAIFIERALGVFTPPAPSRQTFGDVPPSLMSYPFIEDFARRGITVGCSTLQSLYCPTNSVTREQMAIFVVRALGVFDPPTPSVQSFQDVPSSSFAYEFIEAFYARGITTGCGVGYYCPTANVTRGQMAAFLVRAFAL